MFAVLFLVGLTAVVAAWVVLDRMKREEEREERERHRQLLRDIRRHSDT
jgi:hypothetical protein